MKRSKYSVLVLCPLVALLAACGGGSSSTAAAAPPPPPAATPSTQTLAVGDAMAWTTDQSPMLNFTVSDTGGNPISGATIRLFSYETNDPHSKNLPSDVTAVKTEPVPVSLIDTLITDSTGQIQWRGRVPAYLTDLLAVVTFEEKHISTLVTLTQSNKEIQL